MRIGILGATGPAGAGLAVRLASVGHEVLFGSRAVDKAKAAVDELQAKWGDRAHGLIPCDNAWACDAPVVVLAVHADSVIPTVREHAERLAGKIVVSMANNLTRNGNEFNAVLPPHGSVAAEIQALADGAWKSEGVRVVEVVIQGASGGKASTKDAKTWKTTYGLSIAVVCMIAHVLIHTRSKAIQHDLESTTERVFNLLTISGKPGY